jgi:hypothetical protein
MSVDQIKVASAENVTELRRRLGDIGVEISADPRSPRNVRLRELIEAKRGYDLAEASDILLAVDDALPQPRQDVAAIVIWAGTQLPDSSIAALHTAYSQLGGDIQHGPTKELSAKLYERVVLVEKDEKENEIRKSIMGGPDAVHQALDQEGIHLKSALAAEGILQQLVAQVRVFCPHKKFFIRPDLIQIPPAWRTYNPDAASDAPLIDPGVVMGMRTVLLTIGHGSSSGATHFPSLGIQTQDKIASRLRLGNLDGIFYLPLQCYPQAAVKAWREFGGTSESIHNDGRSDDIELNYWLTNSLYDTVRSWIG